MKAVTAGISALATALLVGIPGSNAHAGLLGGDVFAEVGTLAADGTLTASQTDSDIGGVPVVAEAASPGTFWESSPDDPLTASYNNLSQAQNGQDSAGARAVVTAEKTPLSFLQTQPVISLRAEAFSEQADQPLPFASATGSFGDQINFCINSAAGCTPFSSTIGQTTFTSNGFKLFVTMKFTDSVNGQPVGSSSLPPFTGFLADVNYGGVLCSGPTGTLGGCSESTNMAGKSSGSARSGSFADGTLSFLINDLSADQLASDQFFSFGATISASPFSQSSEDVSFFDPISFAVYDPDGNLVNGLSVNSAEGMSYAVDGGPGSAPSSVPEPASGSIFLAGLTGMGLLGWARRGRR